MSGPVLTDLSRLADRAGRTRNMATLLGVEGAAAARYFQSFTNVLTPGGDAGLFEMNNRNRRPPTDPVNALFSFGYAMLTRALVVVLSAVGFDPYRGFYHQPRYGRPALALDMMEPFRPLLVDSAVVTAINNGEIRPTDFVRTPLGVNLSGSGRKRFIAVFERRLSQQVTHPHLRLSRGIPPLARNTSAVVGEIPIGRDPGLPELRDAVAKVMDERLYFVVYDIADAKRWRQIFKTMHGYGDWVQLSVFQCRLTRVRHAELVSDLDNLIHHDGDHVLIIDVGSADKVEPRVVSLGKRTYTPVKIAPIII